MPGESESLAAHRATDTPTPFAASRMNSNPSPAPPRVPEPTAAPRERKKAKQGQKAKQGSIRRWAAYIGGFLLLTTGALALLTEFLLSQANEYRPTIEDWVSRLAGESIEFEEIRIHRRGLRLAFELDDLRVAERAGEAEPADATAPPDGALAPPAFDERLRLDSITFVIDPIRSLLDAVPRVREITLDGLAFPALRSADGGLVVAGHRLAGAAVEGEAAADADAGKDAGKDAEDRAFASSLQPMLAWLASQEDLTFDNSTILWRERGHELPLFFERIRIERIAGSVEGEGRAPSSADSWRVVGTLFPQAEAFLQPEARAMDDEPREAPSKGRIDFTATLEDDSPSLSSWSARVEAKASGLRLESLRRFASGFGEGLHLAGELSGEAQATVRNFRIVRGQGQARLRFLRVASMASLASPGDEEAFAQSENEAEAPKDGLFASFGRALSFAGRIDGSFSFERGISRWRAFFDDLSIEGQDDIPLTLGSLELSRFAPRIGEGRERERAPEEASTPATQSAPPPGFFLRAGGMEIDDLLSLAALAGDDPALAARIRGLGIEGRLDDIEIRWPAAATPSSGISPTPVLGAEAETIRPRGRASFEGLGIPLSKAAIAPAGVEGSIELSPEGGIVARIEAGELAFSSEYWPSLLAPLPGLSGTLTYIPPPKVSGEELAAHPPAHSQGGLVVCELSARSDAGILKATGRLHLPRRAPRHTPRRTDESKSDGPEGPDRKMRFGLRLALDEAHESPASLEAVRALLPQGVVPAPVDRWIDSAMPVGFVEGARLEIKGLRAAPVIDDRPSRIDARDAKDPPPGDTPGPFAFAIEERTIEAELDLALPTFAYASRWPALSDIEGRVRFVDSRMEARIDKGGIFGSTLRESEVGIEDMGAAPPRLRISGGVEGPVADGIRYLALSPLQKNFERLSESLSFDGEGAVVLDIEVPLGRTEETKAQGVIDLERTGVDIEGFDEGLQALEGSIRFDGDRIEAEGLRADYLGQAIRIAIDDTLVSSIEGADDSDRAAPPRRALRIAFDGRSPPDLFFAHLRNIGASLPDILREADAKPDKTHWQATLEIPRSSLDDKGSALEARFRLESDLAGLALDLPEPFGKDAKSIRRLSVDDRFVIGQAHVLHLRYADQAQARFLLSSPAEGFAVERGEILLGPAEALSDRLDSSSGIDPDRAAAKPSGIRIKGAAPTLDIARWQRLLDSFGFAQSPSGVSPAEISGASSVSSASPSGTSADASVFDAIGDIDIAVDRLILPGGRSLPGLRLHAFPIEKEPDLLDWRVDLEGEGIKGWLRLIDARRARRSIRAEFDELKIAAADDIEPDSVPVDDAPPVAAPVVSTPEASPPTLPATELLIRRLVWGSIDLGTFELSTAQNDEGVQFRHYRLRNRDFGVDGIGSWMIDEGEVRSEIKGQLRGEDLGRIIDRIGLDGRVVERGKSELAFNALWTGSPTDIDFERIGGILSLRSGPGSLRNLDRGLFARFFSLLILESLPRRLLFDFDDLFQEGLDYDRLDGDFRLSDGHAHTGDLTIESESLRLSVTGRIGLVEKDYDLVVTLVPKITSALPLTPLRVGEGLLGREIINRFFSYRYSIRGSWDDPIIERMRENAG